VRRRSVLRSNEKVKLIGVKRIDSTNMYLKNNYFKHSSFTFIRADYQTEGRGQFDRKWYSLANENLLFSFLLRNVAFKNIMSIRKIVVDTIIKQLEKYRIKPVFKEPNDIYVNNKKIVGILIETKTAVKDFDYVVIGIGINTNQVEFGDLVATSIKLELNHDVDIKELYKELVKELIFKIQEVD